jgi:hypothetical protein
MIRVTRTLTAVAFVGTMVAVPLAAATPAWAVLNNNEVDVSIDGITTANVPVNALNVSCVNVSGVQLAAIAKDIDNKGGSYKCSNSLGNTVVITDDKK